MLKSIGVACLTIQLKATLQLDSTRRSHMLCYFENASALIGTQHNKSFASVIFFVRLETISNL